MQPPPQALVLHLSPPLSSPANDLHVGTWRPYSNAADFDANAAIILAILLCVLVCVLALTAVIRCFFRHSRRQPQLLGSLPESEPPKLTHADVPSMTEMAPRTLVFSEWMKLAGAQAECAICLSEFLNGEEVRVLPNCRHGFHVKCIDVWLSSHDSCPTCRSNCLTTSPEKNQELHEDDIDVESPPELPRMEPEQP